MDWVAWLATSKPDVKLIGAQSSSNVRPAMFSTSCHFISTPTTGICFGHQIVARALGGSCVPNNGRWEVGPCEVKMTDLGKKIFGLDVLVSILCPLWFCRSLPLVRRAPASKDGAVLGILWRNLRRAVRCYSTCAHRLYSAHFYPTYSQHSIANCASF